ncbi:asparagine synthase (glutamine-hydrolyzing) [Patescibacteria group bacterium]|nr:asparagine synthase (glutamine-hydrolyzing) [Patescibacteria group bacterium]
MCGLFGAIHLQGSFSPQELARFRAARDQVSYRGPDAEGEQVFACKKEGRPDVYVGHRRLAIIDLSADGVQPMTNDNRIWIIFNGEIFNYVELREELRRMGCVFRTKTDTEVILNVYKAWGEDGFAKMNGMWAFALVDVPGKKVILSRDRFSIKPLYYIQERGTFLFASEIKQLLPFQQKNGVNEQVLFTYLKQALIDASPPQTFFKDIWQLKPRHSFKIDLSSGKTEEKPYWEFGEEPVPSEESEALARFRELFWDSVRIRLRSDVPVGVLVSGGLDSSSIAVAANAMQDNIRCFGVASEDPKYSEERFIDLLGEKAGLNIQKFRPRSDEAWQALEDVVWHQDEPFGGMNVVLHERMLSTIKQNTDITVLLSGQGGDEILGGYRKFFLFYLKELFRRGKLGTVAQEVVASIVQHTVLWQLSLAEAKRYIPYYRGWRDPVSRVLRKEVRLEPLWQSESLAQRQLADVQYYTVPALTHYEDRNCMAHSMEVRLPFLDYRLVDFALRMPNAMKIKDGWTKAVLRKSMTELPHEIAWRRDKQGFLNPEAKWLREDLRERILEVFRNSRLAERGLVDQQALLELYKSFLGGSRQVMETDISRFLLAELWMRKFDL